MKINWIKQTFIALFLIMVMISCEYDYIEIAGPPPFIPPDTNDTTPVHKISFSMAITPIFANSNCLNCHSGGLPLNLTAANAYNSIMDNNAVVPFDPAASKIYTYPNPTSGTHGTKYSTSADADSIALWIYQGALNN